MLYQVQFLPFFTFYVQLLDKSNTDTSFFQLFDVVVEADISDEQKARICKRLAEADKVTLQNNYF